MSLACVDHAINILLLRFKPLNILHSACVQALDTAFQFGAIRLKPLDARMVLSEALLQLLPRSVDTRTHWKPHLIHPHPRLAFPNENRPFVRRLLSFFIKSQTHVSQRIKPAKEAAFPQESARAAPLCACAPRPHYLTRSSTSIAKNESGDKPACSNAPPSSLHNMFSVGGKAYRDLQKGGRRTCTKRAARHRKRPSRET